MWFQTLWYTDHSLIQWGAVWSAALIACILDLRTRRIPNELCVAVWLSGVVWALGIGGGAGLLDSLVGSLLAATPFLILFTIGGGGGGDAKLMGALGAWLGVLNGLFMVAAVTIAGGLIAIGYAMYRARFRHSMANLRRSAFSMLWWLNSRRFGVRDIPVLTVNSNEMTPMPYGVAIFTGISLLATRALL